MTLCPIALAVGCQKCPVFKICPLKSVIGDQPNAAAVELKKPTAVLPGKKKVPAKRSSKTVVKPAAKAAAKAAEKGAPKSTSQEAAPKSPTPTRAAAPRANRRKK